MEIQTHLAPQNDHLNLSFVKGTYVDGKKMARIGRKMVIYESQILLQIKCEKMRHILTY